MNAHLDPAARLHTRSAELAASFATIAHTRMAGVPVLNAALRVEAVGFEVMRDDTLLAECGDRTSESGGPCLGRPDAAVRAPVEVAAGLGILITPWFMNLVRLPLQRDDTVVAVGRTRKHMLRGEPFEFIGAHEPAIGAFAACSLFSPMFEFTDQDHARATALAVLAELRDEARAAMPVATANADAPPARRAFLFGRSAVRDARP